MIRIAKYSDLKEINTIYNQAVKHGNQTADIVPISNEDREIWFKQHNTKSYPIFVYEEKDKVIAWLTLSAYRSGRKALATVAEISYYVHQDFQGNGIGSELVKFGIEIAPSFKFENLIAILLGSNKASIGLLKKYNFRGWGTLPKVANIGSQKVDHLYYGLKL